MIAQKPIAILSALQEEQQGLVEQLDHRSCVQYAGRNFWLGELHGHSVVLVLSRIGKVAAATTAAALISRFQAQAIVFTGVAGGVGAGVRVGDVVVASGFVQHDMDASPLFPRYEIPLTGQTVFATDTAWTGRLQFACETSLVELSHSGRSPVVHHGLIATGDRFVNGAGEVAIMADQLTAHGHTALAVEMEGAAVAQVCQDHGIPFAAVRTISDRADDSAHVDFPAFVREVASLYARSIATALLKAL